LILYSRPPVRGLLMALSNGTPMNPGKRRRGCLAVAILVLGALSPALASAQTEAEKKAQARDLYERATRLYDVGKYGDAIGAYEQAYLLIEDPALLFNIGQAYRLWDRPEEAIRAYKNYLRKSPEARNRADVDRKIADLEKVIEDRRKATDMPPTTPSSRPAPGPVGVSPNPLPPETSATEIAQPEPPMATPESEPAGVAVAPPAAAASPKRNWLAYGLIGGGGVCLVFSALMAAVGQAEANKLRDDSKNHEAFDPTIEKTGKGANVLAVVGLVAGVATGGVGVYLLWRGRANKGTTAALVPTLAPNYAGASAVVTF
jgi:tetratricopeptide (TPR) repeat protein